MTRQELLTALEEALVLAPGTMAQGKALADIPQWDSVAVVEFQALLDEKLGLEVQPQMISACTTVSDLIDLAQAKLQG
jgi:acyl carrier protein